MFVHYSKIQYRSRQATIQGNGSNKAIYVCVCIKVQGKILKQQNKTWGKGENLQVDDKKLSSTNLHKKNANTMLLRLTVQDQHIVN